MSRRGRLVPKACRWIDRGTEKECATIKNKLSSIHTVAFPFSPPHMAVGSPAHGTEQLELLSGLDTVLGATLLQKQYRPASIAAY